MLSPTEKKLINLRDKTKKECANFNYRVSKKIENKLSELVEINDALCAIPEKTARNALNDDMVAAIFNLTENMIRILGYSPIKLDYRGFAFVAQSIPKSELKDGEKKFEVITRAASDEDIARQLLMDDHLEVLKHLMDQNLGLPISELPDSVVYHISGNPEAVTKAQNMLRKWGRPSLRTWDELKKTSRINSKER